MRGEGKLTPENIHSALREIRVALLEADANFRVVKQLVENIKQKALGEEVLQALSPSQQVIKIVRDELIKLLGSHGHVQLTGHVADAPGERAAARQIARIVGGNLTGRIVTMGVY
ncbi:MAG: signal recognition particle receptor subunit alpha [Bryobacteraceae bacterium]